MRTFSFATLLAELGAESLNFVKLDTEGHDLGIVRQVLQLPPAQSQQQNFRQSYNFR